MILKAFFCNVNIRLHLKPQAVMQKYICGKIKELYIRLRICCGIDFFILFMMPIVFVILFDMLVMCEFQSIWLFTVRPKKLNSFTCLISVWFISRIGI